MLPTDERFHVRESSEVLDQVGIWRGGAAALPVTVMMGKVVIKCNVTKIRI
jgi:hypothetical protein